MTQQKATNIVWHHSQVTRAERQAILQQKGVVLWFTGLSGSGKSTVANLVAQRLTEQRKLTYLLDGDNVRHGINKDLGFSLADRQENIRRIGEIARLFVDAGVITLASFISPLRSDREALRALLGEDFVEIFVDCSLAICEERDPKGLYQLARQGKIPEFTGISSPYERPENPDILLQTHLETLDESVHKVLEYLAANQLI